MPGRASHSSLYVDLYVETMYLSKRYQKKAYSSGSTIQDIVKSGRKLH